MAHKATECMDLDYRRVWFHSTTCDLVTAAIEADRAAQSRLQAEAVAAAKMWEDRYCRMNAARAAADERLAESRWLVSEARFFREKAPTSPDWERRAAAWLEGTRALAAPQPTDPTKGTDHGDL